MRTACRLSDHSWNYIAAVSISNGKMVCLTIEWTHKRKNSHYISMIR
ncbi:hypothetical protein D1AOALGA4SA_10594 [Olavius algarvensis Delta 1 endosymbiont]|nr:hypothetical protein D1AOALGA4SA_10594 [Olavius algarvensis Delta 1 endosymbiont]